MKYSTIFIVLLILSFITSFIIVYSLTASISRTSVDIREVQDLRDTPKWENKVEETNKEIGKKYFPNTEYDAIKKAANRNDCLGDDFIILLAIRKSEAGGPGKEFGIMNKAANNLDKQAGWAAATIVKNRARWNKTDKELDYISFLGSRYCPTKGENLTDNEKKLNKYWIGNVKYWFEKIKND